MDAQGIGPPPGLTIKEFVPSSSQNKNNFPPSSGAGSRGLAAAAPAFAPALIPAQSSNNVNQIYPSTKNSASDLGLPSEDAILGAGVTPTQHTAGLGSQAAEMFRNMRPFQPSSVQGREYGMMQSDAFMPAGRGHSSAHRNPSGFSNSRFEQLHPPMHQQQRTQMHHSTPTVFSSMVGPAGRSSAPGNWRGRGRGGGQRPPSTGRGGNPSGPGFSRPSIAAYAISPGRMQFAGQFMSETVRQDMQQRSYLISATLPDAESMSAASLPFVVQQYHTLCPLEDPTSAGENYSTALGVISYVFKGINFGDGGAYALRRLDGRQIIPHSDLVAIAEATVERWSPISNHPNVVGLREAFVSDEIDATSALFLSYDYFPGALTIEQAHVHSTHTPQGVIHNAVTEGQLWSYIVQLTSVLRAIHTAGLAAGPSTLAPSKVILVAPSRLRLSAIGISEILSEGPPTDMNRAQREDLTAMGTLLLIIACAAHNTPPSLDILSSHYSPEICHVITGLLASIEGQGFPNWRAVASTLGDRVFTELDTSASQIDTLSGDLLKECENGRILRLLFKLNMVLEKPELMGDTRWAETGDKYLLMLFRDFVFHQVTDTGAPAIDWGPMVEALNKADAGVDEKIILLSRDEASMLVVSYADVKRCLMAAYSELKMAAKMNTHPAGSSSAMHNPHLGGGDQY